MCSRSARVSAGLALAVALFAGTATAQSTRAEWLALRTAKQARHHRIVANPQYDALTLLSVRFFGDPDGNLVGVGEVKNDSTFDLSYSRLHFRFFNAAGLDLGGDWTYVYGGVNARIRSNNRYEAVLLPGMNGFFKIWTNIPASAMASYIASSAGENLLFAKPIATLGSPERRPETWMPLIWVGRPLRLDGQQLSGWVANDDPFTPFCPCGHPSILAYNLRIAAVVYQDGVISDVQSTLAVGPRPGEQCSGDPPSTGILLHESANFAMTLARPANSVGPTSLEWEDRGVEPTGFAFTEAAASATTTVVSRCGWTATSQAPWITVTSGAAGSGPAGQVSFSVAENAGPARSSYIDISGMLVSVFQMPRCEYSFSPSTLYLGPGVVARAPDVFVAATCPWTATSNAPWLSVTNAGMTVGNGPLFLSAQPNLTGVTRKAAVTIGAVSLTVYQSPSSRSTDFNSDGFLDLLWHHAADGRLAAWMMNGGHLLSGTALEPGQLADVNWKPVAMVDSNRDGIGDIVWQHAAAGTLGIWRMAGTVLEDAIAVSPDRVADTNWKVRGAADFNQDGDADLVWQHQVSGAIAVWFMKYESYRPTLINGEPLGPGAVADVNWQIVGTGDFNRDGWPDLLWQHQGDGRIAIWKMRRTTVLEGDLISPGQISNLDWKIRALGDLDGDDMPDLIWQNRATGDLAAWFMNGTTLASGVSLGSVTDTNWHIVSPR